MPIEATPTIYTVRDFLHWQRDRTLELRPPFQRYAIWKAVAKSSLIDSLLRGYPVPSLFLQDRTDPSTFSRRLVVVDGQQRLRTVLSFVDISVLRDADERDRFTLMKIHDPLRAGKTFSQLSEEDREQILSTRFNVNIVGSTVTESELLEIFRRMNTYGARLNYQELRNANFHGVFKEVMYRLSADALDQWLGWGLLTRQDIAEMRDVEFASDLMLLFISGTQSATKKSLDDAYEQYDDEFPFADAGSERFQHVISFLDKALQPTAEVRRIITRMWTYSAVDALQQVLYGGPLAETGAKNPKRMSVRAAHELCVRAQRAIETGELPAEVDKATRGAATDRASREARVKFLLDLL